MHIKNYENQISTTTILSALYHCHRTSLFLFYVFLYILFIVVLHWCKVNKEPNI